MNASLARPRHKAETHNNNKKSGEKKIAKSLSKGVIFKTTKKEIGQTQRDKYYMTPLK